MSSFKPDGDSAVFADQAVRESDLNLEYVHSLSLQQRGELILFACRTAWQIYCSRLQSGQRPASPAPWPKSTYELLRRHAAHARGE